MKKTLLMVLAGMVMFLTSNAYAAWTEAKVWNKTETSWVTYPAGTGNNKIVYDSSCGTRCYYYKIQGVNQLDNVGKVQVKFYENYSAPGEVSDVTETTNSFWNPQAGRWDGGDDYQNSHSWVDQINLVSWESSSLNGETLYAQIWKLSYDRLVETGNRSSIMYHYYYELWCD